MAPKKVTTRASTALDDATEAALAKKKGNAALTNDTLQTTTKNNEVGAVNRKHPRTKDPLTPEGSIHTCSSEDPPGTMSHQVSPPRRPKTPWKKAKSWVSQPKINSNYEHFA
jgi:hypothetical protein